MFNCFDIWGNEPTDFYFVSVKDIARILATKDRPASTHPRIVVVTRGPNPVLVAQGSDPVRSFLVPRTKVVNAVGCGDALTGAFLAVYLLTGDVSEAAKTGISAAVEIAQVTGCKPTAKKLYPLEDWHATHSDVRSTCNTGGGNIFYWTIL